jgi:hypothetical protein
MIAVVVSLVAVVLLVLVVVALGMRSMNRRESALPAERLREMAEKEALTPARSSDDFATREPKMGHFTPDLTPFDEPKPPRQPRPPSARGKRGLNEFGQADDYDDDYWTRLQADEGGFGGSLAARMGASRPVEQDHPQVDADAVTVQQALPSRPQPPRPAPSPEPAIASASLPSNLTDLIAPVQPNPAPTAASLAEQKTVTFAAPTPGAFSPAPTPGAFGDGRPQRSSSRRSGGRTPAQGNGAPSRPDPLSDPLGGSYSRGGGRGGAGRSSSTTASGSMPALGATGPSGSNTGSGPLPHMPPMGPTTSGGFPAAPSADPFAASYPTRPDSRRPEPRRPEPEPPKPAPDNPWAQATSPQSGGWPATPSTADILDDPGPSYNSYQAPVYNGPPASASYEVSAGWATIDDDAITGPSPAVSTPTGPSRTVPPHDRSADPRSGATGGYGYEPRQATSGSPAAWPEPPVPPGSDGASWPTYGDLYGSGPEAAAAAPDGHSSANSRGNHHRSQEPDYPDYYR